MTLPGRHTSFVPGLNRCLTGSFDSLHEYKGWRLQLVSVGTLVVGLFLLESGPDLFTNKTIDLVYEKLFFLVLLDPLFHVAEGLRDDLTVQFELHLFPLDSFTLLHNFDREEPSDFVALFDLLQFLSQYVLDLFHLVKPLIHVSNPLRILLFVLIRLLVQNVQFAFEATHFLMGLLFQFLDLLFDVSHDLLLF